jgi:hypothetical protein
MTNQFKYSAKQALQDYLSVQPDRTARAKDCHQAIERMVGRPVSASAMRYAKRTLGITHRGEGVSGNGEHYAFWWTLPEDQAATVQRVDRVLAKQLVAAYGTSEYLELLEDAQPRWGQVMTVFVAAYAIAQDKQIAQAH